jgi:hypothetical protein
MQISHTVPKKGLKVYKKHKKFPGELYPYYADVQHPDDVHTLGRTYIIPPNKDEKTGFAYNAIPREYKNLTPLQQRNEFENLITAELRHNDLDTAVLVEILADKIIEDEPDYPGAMPPGYKEQKIHELAREYLSKHPELVDVDTYDDEDVGENERAYNYDQVLSEIEEYPWEYFPDEMSKIDIRNGYDTQRDGPAEHRAQKVTPQQIIPLLNPITPEKVADISYDMSEAHYEPDTGELKQILPTKKDLLRIGRKHGMSPYALLQFAKLYDNYKDIATDETERVDKMLLKGSHNDMIRKVLEDVFKHEKEYDSDLRLKNIIPSVQRRFN